MEIIDCYFVLRKRAFFLTLIKKVQMSDEESPKMEILDRYFGHSLSKDILDQSLKKTSFNYQNTNGIYYFMNNILRVLYILRGQ